MASLICVPHRAVWRHAVALAALVWVCAWPIGAAATVCGDANGDGSVTVSDGVQALRAAAGLSSTCTISRCDVDGSGTITVTDGVSILRQAAGLDHLDACPGGAPASSSFDLTIVSHGGRCGVVAPGPLPSGRLLDPDATHLTCGSLVLGGGQSTSGETLSPSGTTTRYGLGTCVGQRCAVVGAPDTALPTGHGGSEAGSSFGAPVPISNQVSPALSACIRNLYASDVSGSIALDTGTVALDVRLKVTTWVTGNGAAPCPRCTGFGGTPGPNTPQTGMCDRGQRGGDTCTTVNPDGLTLDCLPGGTDGSVQLDDFVIDLGALATGTSAASDGGGVFCSGDATHQQAAPGCFGGDATHCTSIMESGAPAGPLTVGSPVTVTLASVFCVPKAGNILIDGASSLPGPGALSITGVLTLNP